MTAAYAALRSDAKVIGLVSTAHLLSHFYQLVIPPLFLQIKEEFGLGYTELGFAMTSFYVVSGALKVAPRRRRRRCFWAWLQP